jgi:hypothetical protein
MGSIIDQAKEAFKNLVPESKAIGSKGKMIQEYVDAVNKKPVQPKAAPPSSSDAVKPGAKYGDRAGEQRIDTTDMTKPLATYHKGTKYVPKTGPANLQEGEQVIPAKDNPYARVMEMAQNKKPAKKEVKDMRTRKTKDGKYIIEHRHHNSAHPMEEHVANNLDELKSHMDTHDSSMTAEPSDPEPADVQ